MTQGSITMITAGKTDSFQVVGGTVGGTYRVAMQVNNLYICPDATMYVSSCSLKTAHTDPILARLDSPVYINIDR